jgi:hypothetical protein
MKIGRGGYYIDPNTLDRSKKEFAPEDFKRDICDRLDDFTPATADDVSDDLADVLQGAKTEILWMRRAVSDLNSQVVALEADARAARTSAAVSDARRQRADRDRDECRALLASFDEDRLEEIITDSIDLDWTPRTAAKAIVRAMKGGDTRHAPPAPWTPDQWLGFGKVD